MPVPHKGRWVSPFLKNPGWVPPISGQQGGVGTPHPLTSYGRFRHARFRRRFRTKRGIFAMEREGGDPLFQKIMGGGWPPPSPASSGTGSSGLLILFPSAGFIHNSPARLPAVTLKFPGIRIERHRYTMKRSGP